MDNSKLYIAVADLIETIRGTNLGEIKSCVVKAACVSLVQNWNTFHPKDKINTDVELRNLDKVLNPLTDERCHIFKKPI